MAQSQEKNIKSILNTEGKRNSFRSVSFRGVELEVLPQYPDIVERPQKVGLFGIVRLLKEKTEALIGPAFEKIKQAAELSKTKYSSQNINCLNLLFRLLSNKRLSSGFNTILSNTNIPSSTISITDQVNSSANINHQNKLIKRTQAQVPRATRSLNTRPSFRSNDSKSIKSTDQVLSRQESQRIMSLSEQARQALISMQRFDRFIYVSQSEKKLKQPIQKQLRRLQKIKNHYKSLRDTYFDNELSITCLYNHMKNLYEMNRDLGEIVKLKVQIQRLQKKIIQNNMKHTAIVKELKGGSSNAKLAQQVVKFKQYFKIHEGLLRILKGDKTGDRRKMQLQELLKQTPQEGRQLISLIQKTCTGESQNSSNISGVYSLQISKLLSPQPTAQKSIKYLQKTKKGLQKIYEQVSSSQQQQAYDQLCNLYDKLIDLYSQSKSKGQGQIATAQLNKLRMTHQTITSRNKQLETRIRQLQQNQQNIKKFQELIEVIKQKMDNKQSYNDQISKNRKLFKRNPNMSTFVLILDILQSFSRNDRTKQIQTLNSRSQTIKEENKQLKSQLNSLKNNTQINQWNKLLNMFPNTIQLPELTKIKRYIELNKQKLPSYQNLLTNILSLITTQIERQQQKKSAVDPKLIEQHISALSQTFATLSQMLEQSKSDPSKSISFCKTFINNSIKDFDKNKTSYSSTGNNGLRSILDVLTFFEKSFSKGEQRNNINDKTIKALQKQIAQLHKSKDQSSNLKTQLSKLQQKIKSQEQRKRLNQLSTKNQQISTKTQQINRLNNELRNQRDQSNKLRNQTLSLQQFKSQSINLRNQNQQLKRQIIKPEEIQRIKQDFNKAQLQNRDLKLKISNQQSLKNNDTIQLNKLRQENRQLSNKVSKLTQQNQSLSLRPLSPRISQQTVSKKSFDEQVQRNQLLNQDIIKYQQNIASMKAQIQSLKNKNNQLTQQTSFMNSKLKQQSVLSQNREHQKSGIPRPNNNKQKYFEQLYHATKRQNQQLRYELSELSSQNNFCIPISSSIQITNSNVINGSDNTNRKLEQNRTIITKLQSDIQKLRFDYKRVCNQKDQVLRLKDKAQFQVSTLKSQINNTRSDSSNRMTIRTVESPRVINDQSNKINQLQNQIRRLNSTINNLKNQQNRNIQSPRISSVVNTYTSDNLSRQKTLLQSQNKRLSNEITVLIKKQQDLASQLNNVNNQLKITQQDIKIISQKQNNQRKLTEDWEIRFKKLTQSSTNQINFLKQSMSKITVDNNNRYSTRARSPEPVLTLDSKRQQFLQQQIQSRKKNQRYLQQKIQTLQSGTSKLNNFIKQLENRHFEHARIMENLRTQNISLQKQINNRGQVHLTSKMEQKFADMVSQKTQNLQRISALENILFNKQDKITKLQEYKQSILKELISELKKTQLQLKRTSDNLKVDKLTVLTRQVQNMVGKLEVDLLDTIRSKVMQQQASLNLSQSKRKQRQSCSTTRSAQFIQNTGIVLHNVLVFLTSQKWLPNSEVQLPQQSQCYFEDVQKFLIDLFYRVFENKNQVLDKQAQQLLMLRSKMQQLIDQQISEIDDEESYPSVDIGSTKHKASIIALQHLFKLYLRTKSPQLLKQILELLQIQDD